MEQIALNPEEREKLLNVLRELDPNVPAEKRRHKRRNTRLGLWIQPINEGGKRTVLKATLVNVAARGVGVEVKQPLTIGHKFLLRLRFREGGGWLVLCQVRNCRNLEDGQYRIGSQFLDRVDDPYGDLKPPFDWTL
jgi:PilZ domain